MMVKAATGLGLTVAATLLAAGCASSGPTDYPVARKLSWISYISGEDLRSACSKNGPERYRLVFNADYSQHVRTYDVTGDPTDGSAVVHARVISAADLSRVDAADPVADIGGETAQTRLTPRQFGAFILALNESGAFEPPRDRLRLHSNGIYWLVNGCHGGRWFFSAYPYPDKRYVDIRFIERLPDIDGTGIPFPALPGRDEPGGPWLFAEKP